MTAFGQLPTEERALYFRQYQFQFGVDPIIVEKDYRAMRQMFLVEPLTFGEILDVLADAEHTLNHTS